MLLMAERESVGGTYAHARKHRSLANTVTSADIAGVSLRTIYRWVRDNRVDWLRTPSGQIRIYVDSLLRRASED
jgi:hypothetical protein